MRILRADSSPLAPGRPNSARPQPGELNLAPIQVLVEALQAALGVEEQAQLSTLIPKMQSQDVTLDPLQSLLLVRQHV